MPVLRAILLASCLLALACGDDSDGGADAGAQADDEGSAGEAADEDPGARPRPGGDGDGDGDGETPPGDDTLDAGMNGETRTALPCDVAGVLEGHCIRCHAREPLMGAPMPLLSWEDLDAPAMSDGSRAVRELVAERILSTDDPMPPEPSPSLSTAQIEAITGWIEDGAEPGDVDRCLLPR